MNKLTTVSVTVLTVVGSFGGLFTYLFGAWNTTFQIMLIFMGLDLLTGTIVALKGKSPKSSDGKLSSKAGSDGLIRKGFLLAVVLMANLIGMLFPQGQTAIREGAVLAILWNEAVSVIENLDLLGVWIPPFIKKFIQSQKKKSDNMVVDENGETKEDGDSE